MVELNLSVVLQILQTTGILVGIFYYVMTLRNAQKNRMIEMVFRRASERNVEWNQMAREVHEMGYGWNTVEEFFDKYHYLKTPELTAKRVTVLNMLNAWGFLLKEGVIEVDFICRLHTPSFIINMWERNELLIKDNRERAVDPEIRKDFEYLYNAVKRKYPHLGEVSFAWDDARDRIISQSSNLEESQ